MYKSLGCRKGIFFTIRSILLDAIAFCYMCFMSNCVIFLAILWGFTYGAE